MNMIKNGKPYTIVLVFCGLFTVMGFVEVKGAHAKPDANMKVIKREGNEAKRVSDIPKSDPIDIKKNEKYDEKKLISASPTDFGEDNVLEGSSSVTEDTNSSTETSAGSDDEGCDLWEVGENLTAHATSIIAIGELEKKQNLVMLRADKGGKGFLTIKQLLAAQDALVQNGKNGKKRQKVQETIETVQKDLFAFLNRFDEVAMLRLLWCLIEHNYGNAIKYDSASVSLLRKLTDQAPYLANLDDWYDEAKHCLAIVKNNKSIALNVIKLLNKIDTPEENLFYKWVLEMCGSDEIQQIQAQMQGLQIQDQKKIYERNGGYIHDETEYQRYARTWTQETGFGCSTIRMPQSCYGLYQ